jgi:hypothetical protein
MKLMISWHSYVVVNPKDLTFTNPDGEKILIHNLTPELLEDKLKKGELSLALSDVVKAEKEESHIDVWEYLVE